MGEGAGSPAGRWWPLVDPEAGCPWSHLETSSSESSGSCQRTDRSAFSHASCSRGHTAESSAFGSRLCYTIMEERSCESKKKKKTRSPRFELKVSEGTPAIFCLTKWKHVFLTSSPEKVRKNDQFSSYLSTPCTHIMVSNHHFEPEIRALWRYGQFQE